MMPYEPVRDVMRRTISNLQFVEAHQAANGPYEVTQLLNSFLGALCHPWETYKTELGAKSVADATVEGWPQIKKEQQTDQDPQSFGDLVRLMRNGIAHGNIEFLPDAAGEIGAVRIWNKDHGVRTWGCSIGVGDMRKFLICFVNLSEELIPT
jgi:hypothetical protein